MNQNRTIRGAAPVALLLGLAGTLLAGSAAHADNLCAKADSFLAPTLTAKSASGWSAVILKVNGGLDPTKEATLKSLGADITRRLPLFQSVAAMIPSRNLRRVAALPFVSHLSSDAPVKKMR